MSDSQINSSYQNVYEEFTTTNYQEVAGENILKLIDSIGLGKFQKLMVRHNGPDRSGIYGPPDLYFWVTSKAKKTTKYIRFV